MAHATPSLERERALRFFEVALSLLALAALAFALAVHHHAGALGLADDARAAIALALLLLAAIDATLLLMWEQLVRRVGGWL
ncbi:MAG: hypothetical protein AB1749_04850 [Pseudomonadota bacterium]